MSTWSHQGASRVAVLAVIALVALLALGGGVAYFVWGGTDQGQLTPGAERGGVGSSEEARLLDDPLPVSWTQVTPEQTIEISLESGGPRLRLGQLDWSPTPQIEGIESVSWRRKREGQVTELIGRGELLRSPITIRWRIQEGDPQLHLSVALDDVAARQLTEPIVATLELPPGQLEHIDRAYQRAALTEPVSKGPWAPRWVQWSGQEQTISVTGWTFDRVEVRPGEAGRGATLRVALWHPAHHPPMRGCPEVEGLNLRWRAQITLGERLDVLPSRLPGGHLAAVAPVFVDPKHHPDAALHRGGPQGAKDWAKRARTLLYGYSSEEDPRFGNGGLLGLELGGALALPTSWAEVPEVRALLERLEAAPVRPAWRLGEQGAQAAPEGAQLLVRERPACELLERGERTHLVFEPSGAQQAARNVLAPSVAMVVGDEEVRETLPGFMQGRPSYLELDLLSGERRALTRQVMGKKALEALLAERGIMWFGAPLVATRNPLEASSAEALLEPERGGQWTLAPSLARALGQIELLDQRPQLLFTDPGRLMEHWRRARRVQLRELADGTFLVLNPGPALPGFTLIAPGDVTPTIGEEETEPQGREVITPREGTMQTWFWWELAPGQTHVRFGGGELDGEGLPSVLWRVEE